MGSEMLIQCIKTLSSAVVMLEVVSNEKTELLITNQNGDHRPKYLFLKNKEVG